MKIEWGSIISKGVGGIFGGLGEAVGKIAGKAAEWVPGPQQYRRNKIREITEQMLEIQRVKPFDGDKYERLRAYRDKLENEGLSSGN